MVPLVSEMLPAAARRRLGAQLLHISSAAPAPAAAAASHQQALTKSSSALPQALAVNRGEVPFGPRLGLMRPSNHLLDDPAAMWCAHLAGALLPLALAPLLPPRPPSLPPAPAPCPLPPARQ